MPAYFVTMTFRQVLDLGQLDIYAAVSFLQNNKSSSTSISCCLCNLCVAILAFVMMIDSRCVLRLSLVSVVPDLQVAAEAIYEWWNRKGRSRHKHFKGQDATQTT